MKCMVKAPAKINLSLDVIGKREDGYHLLQTVMQSVDLYDELHIDISLLEHPLSENQIIILSNHRYIPCNEKNSVYKAAVAYYRAIDDSQYKTGQKITIKIIKKIPTQAGLGGGSSDAAGMLIALNTLYGNPISWEKLLKTGEQIGADVPFCMTGGTALCEGIGEIITPLKPLTGFPVLLIKPSFGIPTPWIFKNLKMDRLKIRPNTPQILESIARQDISTLFAQTANVLEEISITHYPVIKTYKQILLSSGAIGAMMSGSGSTVYGVYQGIPQTEAARKTLLNMKRARTDNIYFTRMIDHGPMITRIKNRK